MELVNTTALPAQLKVSEISNDASGQSIRLGSLVAKATFDVKPSGGLSLADDPLPILEMEVPTELGIMPRDFALPRPEVLEVMVLAAAYAPRGRPVREMTAVLQFGDQLRELSVTGDRTWVKAEEGWAMTEPDPFMRMPLSWSRAFGGSAEIWIDATSPLEVQHPYNSDGRGFDPTAYTDGVEKTFGCPEGFPRIVYDWAAPNVEHPARRVSARTDQPEPCCWAPMPLTLGLRIKPTGDAVAAEADATGGAPDPLERMKRASEGESTFWFAHPDLRLPIPDKGTPIQLSGCHPEGDWRFQWPDLRVVADYVLGDRTGMRPLTAQAALLLPDQGRVAITYRCWFRFIPDSPETERSIRLRIAE